MEARALALALFASLGAACERTAELVVPPSVDWVSVELPADDPWASPLARPTGALRDPATFELRAEPEGRLAVGWRALDAVPTERAVGRQVVPATSCAPARLAPVWSASLLDGVAEERPAPPWSFGLEGFGCGSDRVGIAEVSTGSTTCVSRYTKLGCCVELDGPCPGPSAFRVTPDGAFDVPAPCGPTATLDPSRLEVTCGGALVAIELDPGFEPACAPDVGCERRCPSGRLDCDRDPENACEVDPLVARRHCGGCDRPCPASSVCRDGECCARAACPAGVCGLQPDGCGGTQECGCPWAQACGPDRRCACRDDPCAAVFPRCGEVETACGSLSCPCPTACEEVDCGFVDGRGCAGCPDGEVCDFYRCAPSRGELCFGPPVEWLVGSATIARNTHLTSVYRAGDGARVLVASDRGYWTQVERVCSRLYEAPLLGATRAGAEVRSPASDFPELKPGVDCYDESDRTGCAGWVYRPRVRRDGLELFFASNVPCGDWWDNELYLAHRASVDEPWSAAVLVQGLQTREVAPNDGTADPINAAVLLPDHRTLLVRRGEGSRLEVARRAVTTAGEARFAPIAGETLSTSSFFPGGELDQLDLSCDGRYLLFTAVTAPNQSSAYMAELLSLSPVRIASATPYPIEPGNALGFHEAPDCGGVYFTAWSGDRARSYYRPRVPCP